MIAYDNINEGLVDEVLNFYLGRMHKFHGVQKLDIENIINEVILSKNTLGILGDLRLYHRETFIHSLDVSIYASLFNGVLGTSYEYIDLVTSALLHDVGKLFIPIDLLNKRGKLSIREYEIISTHAERGYLFLKRSYSYNDLVLDGVLNHHRSGVGRLRFSHEEPSLFSRIISISDIFSALTSRRAYHEPRTVCEALDIIRSGEGGFDPEFIRSFSIVAN